MRDFVLSLFIFFVSISLYSQASLNIQKIGEWNTIGMPNVDDLTRYNDIWGYATLTGEEYAIIGNADSLIFIDVTIPSSPNRIFGWEGGNSVTWRDIKTYQTYAYGVCDGCSEGLHVFDMSSLPTSMNHVLTTTSFFTNSHNIYVDKPNARLYAAGVAGTIDLTILDLSTPSNPTLLKHVDFTQLMGDGQTYYVHDLFVRDNIAYCSHGYDGYYVWDMNDLNNITLIGKIIEPVAKYNHSSWVTDDNQYAIYAEEVPTGNPMVVVDLANLSTGNDLDKVTTFQDPLETGGLPTPHNPFIKGDTLIISYYEDGIKAYDISNPTNPTLIGYYDTYIDNVGSYNGYKGCWGTYPYLPSGHWLASDRKYGLKILKFDVLLCDYIIKNYSFLSLGATSLQNRVENYIDAQGILNPGSDVHITAGKYLELQPTFECKVGAELLLQIGDCN